jgi:hypothetical protein
MLKTTLCLTLAIGSVALVGCKPDDSSKDQAPAVPTTMPSVPTTMPAVPAVPAPAVPAAPTTAPSAAVDPSIQALMDKAVADVEAKKWDAAEADLKQLEDLKDKLPPGWMDKVKSMMAAVQAGKLTSGGGLPGGLPGLGK